MRDWYETDNDLAKESRCMETFTMAYGAVAHKLPVSYHLDYMVEREGKATAWAEVKCRNNPSTRYPDLMLSILKWNVGVGLSIHTGLPFILVAGFDDGVFWYRYKPDHTIPIRWGGRTKNTRDRADIEPVAHIPIPLFTKVPNQRRAA